MLGWVAALLLGATGGPPHTDAAVGLELLARARSSAVDGAGGPVALLEVRPSVLGELVAPRLEAQLEYRPRLFVGLWGAPGGRFQHAGTASLVHHPARGLRLRLLQDAAYGYEDFGQAEFGARVWSLEFRPAPVRRFLSSRTELAAFWTVTRRLSLTVAPGYAVQGATDPAEQARVPLLRGPSLGATAAYTLTRRDLLLTQLWMSSQAASTDRSASVLRLWESWRRELTRSTRLELGAGAGLAHRRRGDTARTALLPVLVAGLEHELRTGRRTVEARLEARLAPYLNRLTSDAYERGELAAMVTAPVVERWVFRARLGAAAELRQAPADRLLVGELEAATPLGPSVQLVIGGTTLWQRLDDAVGPPFHWTASVSVRGSSAVNRSLRGAPGVTLR